MNDVAGKTEALPPPTLWECFATAVHFLTRITFSKIATRTDLDHATALNRSVVFFPFVGGCIGALTGIALLGSLYLGLPPLLASFAAIGIEAWVTGAFHEDAFADTCDALGGGWTREQVLEIMKDSRLGTYGTIAIVIGVVSRGVAIGSIAEASVPLAVASIVAAASIGRIAIVLLMTTTAPIADRQSQAKDVSGSQSIGRAVVAVCIAGPFWIAWLVLVPLVAACSLLCAAILFVWYRRMIVRRVGGTTGDLLGASGFLTQLLIIVGGATK